MPKIPEIEKWKAMPEEKKKDAVIVHLRIGYGNKLFSKYAITKKDRVSVTIGSMLENAMLMVGME